MKFIMLLNRFFKGIRLSALALSLVMLLALSICMMVYLTAERNSTQLQVVSSPGESNVAVYQLFSKKINTLGMPKMSELIPKLEADNRVKQVYTITSPKTVSYENRDINLLFYTPEIVELLPGLKRLGIDFENNPNGCVIIGYDDLLGDLRKGDDLIVRVGKEENIRIPIVGRERGAQHLELQTSATPLRASHILQDGDVVIMLATDEVMEQVGSHASRIIYHRNILVEYQDGVSQEERMDVLETIAPQYEQSSLKSTRVYAENTLTTYLGENLPLPLFLLCASLMAYFSIVVLTFKRREKDLAMFYLCGGSRAACAGITFTTFSIIAFVPIVLMTTAIVCWEEFDLSAEIFQKFYKYKTEAMYNNTYYTNLAEKYPGIKGSLIKSFGAAFEKIMTDISQLKVDTSCLWIVFGFYGITALVAFLVTWLSMRKHSPLTYLRGVNE